VIPNRALLLWSLVPLVLSLGMVIHRAVLAPLLALDLVLLLVALADLAWARFAFAAEREYAGLQAVGRPFPVVLRVRVSGQRALQAWVTDDAPGATEGLPARLALNPGSVAEWTYSCRLDRRGQHHFGPVTVRVVSPLGLWMRQLRVPLSGEVRVVPNFAQLRSDNLATRLAEQRAPVRVRRRTGGESEFERLRPYVAGDSYRAVDWKATARRRELVSREYGQEVNQNVLLVLDAGRTMSGRFGELTGFDHGLNASMLLGQAALKHGDRVGLMCFDREVRCWVPPRGGARSGARLIRGVYDIFPTLHEPDYAGALRELAQRVRRRSLVVLVTAIQDEVNTALADALISALGKRHLVVVAWLKDPDLRARLGDPEPAVRAAAAFLDLEREQALRELRRRGALVVDAEPEQLTSGLLTTYLEVKARRLL
jgi:uncharacterized protein (DUF58 family)